MTEDEKERERKDKRNARERARRAKKAQTKGSPEYKRARARARDTVAQIEAATEDRTFGDARDRLLYVAPPRRSRTGESECNSALVAKLKRHGIEPRPHAAPRDQTRITAPRQSGPADYQGTDRADVAPASVLAHQIAGERIVAPPTEIVRMQLVKPSDMAEGRAVTRAAEEVAAEERRLAAAPERVLAKRIKRTRAAIREAHAEVAAADARTNVAKLERELAELEAEAAEARAERQAFAGVQRRRKKGEPDPEREATRITKIKPEPTLRKTASAGD